MNFGGKTVLVTGSTSGIGAACARLFAEHGASVMVSGRDVERGRAVVEAIETANAMREAAGERGAGAASGAGAAGVRGADAGGVRGAREGAGRARVMFTPIDLRDAGACDRLVSTTIERLGGLDILVNNAGVLYSADALGTSDAQWLDTLAVNVNALFYLSRAAVRHMKASGGGAIVNMASEWGLNGEPGHVAYCASKGAVLQITRCMALDHASDRIRVNAVSPGEIHTQMVDDILATRGGDAAQNLRALAAGIPMRRLAQPVEVARCVCFLASDLASYVTGTNLSVDGGNDATAGPYPGPAS